MIPYVITPSLRSLTKGLEFGEANADRLFKSNPTIKIWNCAGIDMIQIEAYVLNSRGGYQATVVQMDYENVDPDRAGSACGCEAGGGCYHGAALAWWWLLQ